jgi:hypothetical protein
MDIISHGTWGSIIARKHSIAIGFLFGVLPDILGLGWYFGAKPYFVSHSLIAFITVAIITRKIYLSWVYSEAYLLHILFDVLTHSRGTFTLFYVPFLWKSFDPIRFHGWSWWHEGMILEIINWVILLVILTIILVRKMRKRRKLSF